MFGPPTHPVADNILMGLWVSTFAGFSLGWGLRTLRQHDSLIFKNDLEWTSHPQQKIICLPLASTQNSWSSHIKLYQILSNTQGAFTSQKKSQLDPEWPIASINASTKTTPVLKFPVVLEPFSMKLWRFHRNRQPFPTWFSNLSRSSRLIYAYVSQGLASNPATPWIFMFERIKKIGIIDMVSQPQEPSIKVRSKSSRKGGLLTKKQTISRNDETNLTRGTAL